MPTDPAKFMVPGGLDDVHAKMLADMIDAGEVDGDALCRAGALPDFLARRIERMAQSGAVDTLELHMFGMAPGLASAILNAVVEKLKEVSHG